MASKITNLRFDHKSSLERRMHIAKDAGGIYSAIRYPLLCSRFLGLLPLTGLSSTTSEQLRFTLRSPYTVLYVISMLGQCLMFMMSFYWLLQRGISLINITNLFFYFSSMTSLIILMNVSRYWPQVTVAVESVEAILPPFTRNITIICNTIMVLVFTAAVVEHILSVCFGFAVAYSCGSSDVVETFFRSSMPWIFDYTDYSLWKGILSEIFNIQSTFIWSFNDLLIMVLSIYLTEHIIGHNALLRRAVIQEHFSAMEFRIQYLNVVRLVTLVNKQVGIYILASFGSNLYWICTQLFNSLNNTKTGHFIACYDENPEHYLRPNTTKHAVYFTYSFSFIVLRALLVLLLASRIHTNSKVPLGYLYGLPSEKFDVEVERFIAQINNIKVALSGLDFFYVTRTMILTVERFIAQINNIKVALSGLDFFYVTRTMILTLLGTIVTYELVMLQFNK